MMKALPMKTNVSVVMVAALTQQLGTMLFFEEVSAAYSQRQMIINRRGASALEQSLPRGGPLTDPPGSNPNPHVPTPSHQHNVHSTVEASAAILPVLATCPPASHCNPNVPTPGCSCSPPSKEEQKVKVNGKGELMRNYRTSITTGKHASTVEASAASTCAPSFHCNPHVQTPGCPCSPQSKKEQQVKVNGQGELMRNYRTSIAKHASADHIRRGPLVDSLAFHTTH